MLLTQQLNVNASKNLGKAAFRYLGKETNFSDLRSKIAKLSYLYLHDLGAHARVAFVARNSPSYLASFFALSNTRSLTIPIDPDSAPEEIVQELKDTKATHIAVTNDLISKVREAMQAAHINLPLVEIEKKQGGEYSNSFTPPPEHLPADNDQVVLLRTRGFGGKTKYVPLNHKQLIHAGTSLRGLYKLGTMDRFYSPLNWSHPFSFVHSMLLPMMTGVTSIIDHGAQGKELLDFMVEAKVSRIVSLPPFLLKLLLVCKDEQRRIPASVKSLTVGGGRLPTEVETVISTMGVPLCYCYGQAEAGWTLAMQPIKTEEEKNPYAKKPKKQPLGKGQKQPAVAPTEPYGTPVGKGLAGLKYKVLDFGGDEIPGRESREGLLAVTGPSIMTSYFDNEKDSKMTIRGTWLYTGDLVRLEGEGEELEITFLARKEDAIRDEKTILIPDGIDKALKSLSGVADGAGFVVADTKGILRFACAVVKAPGTLLNEKQVLEHLGTKIPGNEVPKVAIFTDFIPRDTSGNVNRFKLRAQFSGVVG